MTTDRIAAYGDHVLAVEPTGAEPVPASARHGRPLGLLWTWTSPNMEFATVFVGVLGVGVFGLDFWSAALAIVLGTALGAVAHGFLGLAGPRFGVPQMVAGRTAFGYRGNALPAGLNALTAGIGWFAVNSVSAAYALGTLTGWPVLLCLFLVAVLQVAIAFFGHNFIHTAEKYTFPVLTVVFLVAAAVILGKAHLGAATGAHAFPGAFLLTAGAAFGYAAGWTPYGSDYTRYLPASTPRRQVGLWPAVGVFWSCVLLEIVGAASVTITVPSGLSPTAAFVHPLPGWLADLTLLAITVGGIAANALNIYSGALSFVAMGIRLPASVRRATVALVFGVAGTAVAWSGLHDSGAKYTDFLLVITYWIGPWLAVVFLDRWYRRGQDDATVAADLEPASNSPTARFGNWAGPVAMAVGTGLGVWLFSNQTEYTGLVARHVPQIGDIAFLAGFLIAGLVYAALRAVPAFGPVRGGLAEAS
ncbi:purine-cytosine permease family protein [Streptacidiphilus jiangxiensis]|uniref:NCS1 nucleoside transporter family n=1 Tax=Streptacidiphilus jiangxiensis TaxID=235985 RepID=A0A1H7FBT3_STRJI|nr:cytosine permease [Streptacidiphilus jiangxiensis]SEK20685.1 NCS1 nucleoside transporter family [Streptacidiphilus jiangxiensis]